MFERVRRGLPSSRLEFDRCLEALASATGPCHDAHVIPLRDNIPSSTFPWVNVAILVACSLVFLVQLAGSGESDLAERFGMIPARVLDADRTIPVEERFVVRTPIGARYLERTREMAPSAVPGFATLLTCMFLHGGWLHFLGNMWFLWIFGDNVEDRFGHGRYLVFYLAAGVGASLSHLLTAPSSTVPTIGASGAIAAVMGAYLMLYPRARMLVLVPILLFMQLMVLPAALFLGLWFALQLFQGTLAIGATQSGGVAWWAHIGGFAIGALTAWLLRRSGRLRSAPLAVALTARRLGRGPGEPRSF